MNGGRASAGFTLVEVTIVIALLGILAAVSLAATTNGRTARDLVAAREAVAAELRRVRAVAQTSAGAVQADFRTLDDAYGSDVSLTPDTLTFTPPHGGVSEAGGVALVADFVDLGLEVDGLESVLCVRRYTGRVVEGSCAP